MNLKSFLKDKIITITLLVFAIITIEIFLLIYPLGGFIKIYIPIVILITYLIGIMIEYYKKKKFYNNFSNMLEQLEEKYLITEIVNKPNFVEGILLNNYLQQINKSMIEHINKYKYLQQDYKEYIELWIHEIKTPIATSKMIIENNKNMVTKSINEELDKVENYIEQALFYARSNSVEKDYIITKNNLKEIVNTAILKNKTNLLSNKISMELHELEQTVYTDSKWVVFIVNKILQNSVKYSKNENRKIEIYAKPENEKVILYIKDNGIGIKQGEIKRIFEKGFTGTNGRITNKKSTGIGLYLCKKLCDKLGLDIYITSKENDGTEVKIIFPKNSYYLSKM